MVDLPREDREASCLPSVEGSGWGEFWARFSVDVRPKACDGNGPPGAACDSGPQRVSSDHRSMMDRRKRLTGDVKSMGDSISI